MLDEDICPPVHKIKHHDVIDSGIFPCKFLDKTPREWIKHALKTLEDDSDLYMVEVMTESSF
jgi:hypothetical protein